MLFPNILLAVSATVVLLLVLFVFVSNPKKLENRILALFLSSIFLWLFANFLTNITANQGLSLFFARTTLIGPVLLAYSFLIFCHVFTRVSYFSKKEALLLAIPPVLLLFTFPTTLNIESVKSYGRDTVTGPIYIALIPMLLVYFIWGFVLLRRNHKSTKNTLKKAQIRYIFFGVGAAFIPSVIINGILPIFGNLTLSLYGPNAIVLFAIFMSLAIVKHRLLDIRLIVARSATYIFTILIVGFIYGFTAFTLIGNIFFKDKPYTTLQQVVNTVLAIILVFTFPVIKRFIDRLSNKFFYRDAYDAQTLLDHLNQVLVSTIDLNDLLKSTAQILDSEFKVRFSIFQINEKNGTKPRLIGYNKDKTIINDSQILTGFEKYMKGRIAIADELQEGEPLHEMMRENDIAIIIRLGTTGVHQAAIGYLVLGDKQNGSPYDTQDLRVLEIITNELVIAIQNALRFEEIQQFNITLQQKVDEATRQLRKTNEKLKELDETKDEFISMASHQLRTPLTSMKGYVSMVLEGDTGRITPKQRQMLDQAFASAQRMVYLIADLLNVSRLRTGKFVIENKPTQLIDVVSSEMEQLTGAARAKNLELAFDKPKSLPALNLDETKIRQVVMNFIDNALYYTPVGGRIQVKLTDQNGSVEFTVTDDGLGVPKSEQHHLFTKFYRAGNARKARPDGTGLGLFMAKKVIVAQGGAIIFSSTEGKGSTFGFTLPKTKLAAPTT